MTASSPPNGGGLSLYANLLEPAPDSQTTISSGPVLYNASAKEDAKKPLDPSLRFQPIRRPQPAKPKSKLAVPKTVPGLVPANKASAAAHPAAVAPKTTLADWTATEEDEWRYGMVEKAQRGGRRRKKRKAEQRLTDWDELYDPSKPTNVVEYLQSDEKIAEVREWKALLYRHRRRKENEDTDEEEEGEDKHRALMGNQFAPPPSYSFAPPPQSPPRAALPDDTSGDDVYARRLAMTTAATTPYPPSDSLPGGGKPLPPASPPPSHHPPPEPDPTATISRAPVRYTQPPPDPMDEDQSEHEPTHDEPISPPPQPSNPDSARSSVPGQVGFASRLMSKYGWKKGTGLGAESTGILNPLRVQVEKRKRKADSEGGGWAEPAAKAKIFGGRRKDVPDGGGFGAMSEVIVLRKMLDGMEDLRAEIEAGLGSEIGEECGEKYGRVERIYIDVEDRQVFIKFTDQVSALKAVNELEGRIFNGNSIEARFYDTERFERGIYR